MTDPTALILHHAASTNCQRRGSRGSGWPTFGKVTPLHDQLSCTAEAGRRLVHTKMRLGVNPGLVTSRRRE